AGPADLADPVGAGALVVGGGVGAGAGWAGCDGGRGQAGVAEQGLLLDVEVGKRRAERAFDSGRRHVGGTAGEQAGECRGGAERGENQVGAGWHGGQPPVMSRRRSMRWATARQTTR